MGAGNIATKQMVQNVIKGVTPPQSADKANKDGNGAVIADTYAKQNGTYSGMTVGKATSATNADTLDGKPATEFATSAQGDLAEKAYQKPSTGIPKADLSADVQASLNKANSALQSAPVTSVNGQTGAVNITEVAVAGKTKNALTIKVNGSATVFDGSAPKEVALVSGGDDPSAVKYTPQTLSADQKTQARTNIGAQAAGDYATKTELSGKADTTYVNAQIATRQVAGDYPTTTEMNKAIDTKVSTVVGGAPEAFDTLKEVADWIANDKTGTTALVNRVTEAEKQIENLKKEVSVFSVSIPASKWTANSVSLTSSDYAQIGNVTADSFVEFIVADAAAAEFILKEVELGGVAANNITFSCKTAPTAAINGVIKIFN